MRTVRTIAAVRDLLARERSADRTVGLVPTMGAFHAGHRSLIDRAVASCDTVVVSLFVNPTQFGAGEDLAAYPRDERRDAEIAAAAGADLLFVPTAEEIYPAGFATSISVGALTETLEGAHRPGHFDGVATVVAKLLSIVGPDRAFFGQKDAQQALVIEQLVRDLNFPVEVEICPTVRDPDGLALSSRNAYLDAEQRRTAPVLFRALSAADAAVAAGERDGSAIAAAATAIFTAAGVEPEYVACVDAATLRPLAAPAAGGDRLLIAVAAQIGPARLIDNVLVSIPTGAPSTP